MDMSKLPRLSQTDAPPPTEEPVVASEVQPVARAAHREVPESFSFAEIWISIAVGAILLLFFPTMAKYVASKLLHTEFLPFTMPDGTVVPYPKVFPQFWSDLCVTLFALVLIVEGLALAFVRKRWLVATAFVLTVAATGLNLWFIVTTFSKYGPPLVSLLAVAFGVYIASYQWRLLKMLGMASRRA